MTLNEALVAFIDLLEQTIFQPQKTNALIQVSGLLEASGCEFDSLWVMGITDHCLPQKTRLSAFIPPQLQRELFFPHSIPARELHFAQQTLQRLHKGSPDTVFSYARLEGDNPNLPSSLIVAFPPYQPLTARTSNNNYSLIPFPDSYLIPIQPNELISGGTALLANQAKCPFKAFSEHRLKAKAQNPGADGLDNREKGQLIHKVMELLWRNLGSQAVLIGLDEAALEQHIDKAIHLALAPLQQIHPDSFPPLVQQVEYQRLQRLVLCSLEWEKQRPPFTIKALEESYTIDIAGLNLKVRVDRLDEVANKKWVIDYKSSLPAAKPWNEDRPTEPQLLLYALLDEQINTLILMQLKTGKMFCNGLSEEDHSIHGISRLKKEETWANSRSTWQQQLTQLAEEFLQGHCVPQPVSAALCLHCDFQNLCRFQTHD